MDAIVYWLILYGILIVGFTITWYWQAATCCELQAQRRIAEKLTAPKPPMSLPGEKP